jgi:hypothetical protein
MAALEIELLVFIHISAKSNRPFYSAWKEAEGALLIGWRKKVLGSIELVLEAKFNNDGVEIDVNFGGSMRRISPSNLSSLNVVALREGSTPFSPVVLDKYNAYIRERSRIQRRNEIAKRMSVLFAQLRQLRTAACSPHVLPPVFTERDFSIVLKWAKKDTRRASLYGVLDQIDEYQAWRLISARAAELAAAKYYRNLGCTVEDVSVLQLDGKDQRWITHDLVVDGHPVDVKNARKSFSSPNGYVEHCIPLFKQERVSGEGVSIVGVLSEYSLSTCVTEGRVRVMMLGEVRLEDIITLTQWADRKFGSFMDIRSLWKPDYQPAWVFEYPALHYSGRAAAIDIMTEELRCIIKERWELDEIDGVLLALTKDEKILKRISLSENRRRLLFDIRSIDREFSYSRPALFIYVMGVFLDGILKGADTSTLASNLRYFLFGRSDLLSRNEEISIEDILTDFVRGNPLGLLDPTVHIFNFINALESVAKACSEQGYQFRGFRMTHPSILRGITTDGRLLSLLAFCGGWRRNPKVKCGNVGLYLGGSELCSECGFLICERCRYCSKGCTLCNARQEEEEINMRF